MPADYVEIKLRLYEGRDDDLIRWWQNLNAPPGGKSWAAKEALRRGLDLEAGRPAASVDPEAVAAAVEQALEQAMERFLVEVRRVVEAALASAPARPAPQEAADVDDEGKRLLREFVQGLRLGDEE